MGVTLVGSTILRPTRLVAIGLSLPHRLTFAAVAAAFRGLAVTLARLSALRAAGFALACGALGPADFPKFGLVALPHTFTARSPGCALRQSTSRAGGCSLFASRAAAAQTL